MLSTGEKLAAALALNRFDWLAKMDYTIAEAIERIGPQWAALIPDAAKLLDSLEPPAQPCESYPDNIP
ncbi:hypothetical protein [Xanthomonas citri]|uniref:hypothetical protein n=1 Tax=Xanthomonas citri TaxID=346 RepID=UPI00053832EB|nr:hypothetical protein [Xanthomonas citri]KGU42927.1 hypothetical protein NY97_15880 [Xanthomonas citri pv. fuscans]KIJ01210.1 hypothetical protein ST33_08855 [Xanthomonas citri pv. fuscans]